MVSPRARVTVGLQFLHHRQAVPFRFAHSPPQRHGLVQRPGQILDVMTDFVCDHVCLGALTGKRVKGG
jgi:hypothetical protein